MPQPTGELFAKLVAVIARLRAPDGCPWDREQTPQSAAPYLLEEAHEALEAIDTHDTAQVCEELGDLLLQVVFQTQMVADTARAFTIDDVVTGVTEKLIRRHPHVFADTTVSGVGEVLANWEQIKRTEKPQRGSILDGLPKGLPALLLAFRLGQKAGRVGFDWPQARDVLAKITEEVTELETATANRSRDAMTAELGDLLFAIVQWARWMELDPEGALRQSNLRFTRRFQWMEQQLRATGREPNQDLTPAEWETLWQQAKAAT